MKLVKISVKSVTNFKCLFSLIMLFSNFQKSFIIYVVVKNKFQRSIYLFMTITFTVFSYLDALRLLTLNLPIFYFIMKLLVPWRTSITQKITSMPFILYTSISSEDFLLNYRKSFVKKVKKFKKGEKAKKVKKVKKS